jgi:methylated-DNA-[protein]-cysteine S-methyltransferase
VIYRATLETKNGPVTVESDGEALVGVWLGRRRQGDGDAICGRAVGQLEEYFAGKRRDFDLPLRIHATPFATTVLERLEQVPHGRTLTYGGLAGKVGNPKAARAVGNAVGSNPLSVVIP